MAESLSGTDELTFSLSNGERVLAEARERLTPFLAKRLGEVERNRILLAVEEALVNTFEHGYNNGSGEIEVRSLWNSDELLIELSDRAPVYDPTAVPLRSPETLSELGADGGYGLFLLRTLMKVEHRTRNGGGNVLILHHRLPAKGQNRGTSG